MKTKLLLLFTALTSLQCLYAQNWNEAAKLVASDRTANDWFGFSVSVSGNYAIVGSMGNSTNTIGADSLLRAGAAYIFEQDSSGNWIQKQKLVASDRAAGNRFGVSVSMSENYAIVGTWSGLSAYIFERDTSGIWMQKQKITSSDTFTTHRFGTSVSISGNYAIIGESTKTLKSFEEGVAYLFERDTAGTWIEKQRIVASDSVSGGAFGQSVSISGNYVIVGSTMRPHGGTGSIYIFEQEMGVWEQKQKITPPTISYLFGISLSISGNRAIVGGDDFPYIFERDSSGIWTEKQKLSINGKMVAVSDNYAIAGKGADSTNVVGEDTLPKAGASFLFEKDGTGNWIQQQKVVASDRSARSDFGGSGPFISSTVDISGNYTIIGSCKNSTNTAGVDTLTEAGAAYIFETCTPSAPINTSNAANMSVCAGNNTTLSASGTGTLGWYSAASGGIYLGGGNSFTTSVLSSATTYYVQDSICAASNYRTAITVNVKDTVTATQTLTICAGDSITVGTNTYKTSGTFTDVLTASNGCDSTVTTNLTVLPANSSAQTLAICAGDSITVGTNTYKTSGTFTDVLTAANGCDSTVTTNLTVLPANATTQTRSICEGDSVVAGTTAYKITGTYIFRLTGTNSCDSTITLNLTVNKKSSDTITQTACNSYTLNGTAYTANGIYTQTLTNAAGCDSVITLNLSIDTIDKGVTQNGMTFTANATNANYQWIDCGNNNFPLSVTGQSYTATKNGNYAVVVTKNTCSDTSICYSITGVGVQQINNFSTPQLNIFPNPNNGAFTINANAEGVYTIVNTLGEALQHIRLNAANNYTISIDNLSNGMYFIIGQNSRGFVNRKIVVVE